MSDAVVGAGLLAITGLAFLYYTLWVIVLPFVDEDQVYVHSLFPDPALAVGLPLVGGVIGLACIGLFVFVVMVKPKLKAD